MKNKFTDRLSHKFFIISYIVLSAIYFIESIDHLIKASNIKRLLGTFGGVLFDDSITIRPSGAIAFFIATLFVILILCVVLYLVKLVKEDKITVFKNVPFFISIILVFLVFNIDFVISYFNTGLMILASFLTLVASLALLVFSILSLVRKKIIVFKDMKSLCAEFKVSGNKKVVKEVINQEPENKENN